MRAGPKFRLGHRPGLDGLRGVAIILVLIAHVVPQFGGSYGIVGVQVFFVLSGFLITTLLLEEHEKTGGIRVGAFYARRALRLLPAVTILVLVLLAYAVFVADRHDRPSLFREALGVQFYYANWGFIYDWFQGFPLSHTWSLSVEEQFYLIWPAILLLLLGKASRETILKFVVIGAGLLWLERYLLYSGTGAEWDRIMYGTDTRGDGLLIGCSLALAVGSGLGRSLPGGQLLNRAALGSAVGLAAIAIFVPIKAPFTIYFGAMAVAVFSAVLISALVPGEQGRLRSALEMPWLGYVGKISYSLYLWHYFVLEVTRDLPWPEWSIAVTRAVGIPALAMGSYYLVERPFLKLKKRFERLKPD